jgi:hypothetical protein
MSIAAVGSSGSQTIASLLLQELNASGASAQKVAPGSNLLEDLLTLSPAAQQLAKSPDTLAQAMQELLAGQKDPNNALLTALMNQQSSQSDPSALLTLFKGTRTQDSLFATLGSSDGTDGGSGSIFG